jgi:NAD(P)H-dependent FMN reductase
MLNLALIIGSTRPQRFADTPAQWIAAGAAARTDFHLDILDLRDANLPELEAARRRFDAAGEGE